MRAWFLTLFGVFCAFIVSFSAPQEARASDRAQLEAFLNVTGFDVALESIRLSASAAPEMIGLKTEDFGPDWSELVSEVFDTRAMHDMAIEILSEGLEQPLLDHAIDFYASDLGKRLVVAENAAHMKEDDDGKREAGDAIVAGMTRHGAERLEMLKRLNAASGTASTAVMAMQELQVRFLMAAASAGVIKLQVDEAELRAALSADEGRLLRALQISALSGAAYTYQAFSDDDILAYAEALEHDHMRKIYMLMNAVQFEIMANRFEALAEELAKLKPSQAL